MKKTITILALLFFIISITSCVESSKKYKNLQAQLDSLTIIKDSTSAELEEVFATLNEVENGLRNIREAENIITVQSAAGGEISANKRVQMKQDVLAISDAINGYKKQIAKLKSDNRVKSVQFQKRLDVLTTELEEKSILVANLSKQLEEKNTQLRIKTKQIATLDEAVSNLRSDVASLSKEKELHKETIESQEQLLNTAFYIIGTKDELINSKVLSKGGLFRSAKISYEADQSAFIKIDIREVKSIHLNAKKAKIISVHPTGTYSFENSTDGTLILRISSTEAFWEQTKYLVIQIQ